MMMKKIIILSLLIFTNLVSQNNSDQLKREALEHIKFEKYGEAIELLNRYISANPQKTDGYTLRSMCYEKRGIYELAVYDIRTASKLNPSDKSIQENLSRITDTWYVFLKNLIAGYKREIAINPNLPVNYLEIGKAYKNLGEWAIAEEWYDKYLTMEEASADEIIRYSEILSKLNKISKGEPILKKYTERYPDDHRLWSRCGYFTLWLGKNKIAIEAFENALGLRPYFKEAMDGLEQAKGNGLVYVVNDTTKRSLTRTKSFGYAIDRYFKKLKSNPNDHQTRTELIKELIKTNRFDEAEKELIKLFGVESYSTEYKSLSVELENKKNEYYSGLISKLKRDSSQNPDDEKLLLKIADSYINIKDYFSAKSMYEDFLTRNPFNENVRYRFAVHSSWFKDYCTTKNEIDILILQNPDNPEYRLLKLNFALWVDDIKPELEADINLVDAKLKDSQEFLITAAVLELRLKNLDKAQNFIHRIELINSQEPRLAELKLQSEIALKEYEEQKLQLLLEEARNASYFKNCKKAIDIYKKYLLQKPDDKNVLRELSNTYECDGNFKQAIKVYDDLLLDEFVFNDALQRAKLLLWSGDSVMALREFRKLNSSYPEDNEVKLLLGDAYLANGLERNAKQVYSEMLLTSPESYIINKRLKWLTHDNYSGEAGKFPSYVMLTPEANFFNDNIGLNYRTQGIGLQVGLTDYIAAGVSFYRGDLQSDSADTDFNILKGSVYLRLNKHISASAGFGRTRFNNSLNKNITEVSVKAEKESEYYFALSLNASDASHIMYSPFLVNERIDAKNISLNGKYFATTSTFLAGRFMYNTLSDSNSGYHLDLRLGENFNNNISAGYEYSFINYKERSLLYWSPDNFESHSLWAEWSFLKNQKTTALIGGKVGYIPANDFMLREISGSLSHKFFEKLTLQLRVVAGSTVQRETGYSSVSAGISLFWTL